jgi:hypothetical protein
MYDFEIGRVAETLRDLNVNDKMVYDGGKNVRIHHIHKRFRKLEEEEYAVRQGSSQD